MTIPWQVSVLTFSASTISLTHSSWQQHNAIGGQLNLANQIPGKEEFNETLRYYKRQLELTGVRLRLNLKVTAEQLISEGYAAVILASGVIPRIPEIPGIDHTSVLSYVDVLQRKKRVGQRVAIVGAGGIGFDVAEYITHPAGVSASLDRKAFLNEWGVDMGYHFPGAEGADAGFVLDEVYEVRILSFV